MRASPAGMTNLAKKLIGIGFEGRVGDEAFACSVCTGAIGRVWAVSRIVAQQHAELQHRMMTRILSAAITSAELGQPARNSAM
ncbi:MAG: hypothetical protein ACKVP4_03125 [Hyphomicrobium sp.]